MSVCVVTVKPDIYEMLKEPLDESVIIGATRVHLVGAPTDPWWLGGGSHHALCSHVSGDPMLDPGRLPMCQKCLRIQAAISQPVPDNRKDPA